MAKFFLHRVIYNKAVYVMLLFGTAIAVLHIFQDAIAFISFSNDSPFLYTPYQSWIEFGISSNYRYIFFLLLPIIAAIVFSDTYARDLQTGYFKAIVARGKMKSYFTGLYVTNFIIAGITVSIPLLINLYLAFMTMPNIKPDPVLDLNPLGFGTTMFPDLYYNFPLIHTFLYILLAFIFAGMYATISLSVSFYIQSRFFIIISSFIINMFLTIVLNYTEKYAWVPSNFLTQLSGQPGVSFTVVASIFIIGLTSSTLFYVNGVKRRVIV